MYLGMCIPIATSLRTGPDLLVGSVCCRSLKLLHVTVDGEQVGLAVYLGSEFSVFVFSLLEIYRRTQWILLRLEWQWVNHHKMRPDPEELANPEPETPPTSPSDIQEKAPLLDLTCTTPREMDV